MRVNLHYMKKSKNQFAHNKSIINALKIAT